MLAYKDNKLNFVNEGMALFEDLTLQEHYLLATSNCLYQDLPLRMYNNSNKLHFSYILIISNIFEHSKLLSQYDMSKI